MESTGPFGQFDLSTGSGTRNWPTHAIAPAVEGQQAAAWSQYGAQELDVCQAEENISRIAPRAARRT